jgi:hypothetical protein
MTSQRPPDSTEPNRFESWARLHFGQGYGFQKEDGTYISAVTRWAAKAFNAGFDLAAAPQAAPLSAGEAWISVKDQFPPDETDVLVVAHPGERYDIAGIFNGEWQSQITERECRHFPTHWQHIPATPAAQAAPVAASHPDLGALTRYEHYCSYDGGGGADEEVEADGSWVRYDDVVKLLSATQPSPQAAPVAAQPEPLLSDAEIVKVAELFVIVQRAHFGRHAVIENYNAFAKAIEAAVIRAMKGAT